MNTAVTLIAAMTPQRVIGANNRLLWHLPRDLAHFKQLTTGKTVVMGRKTFESIGKPLVNRTNLILSKQQLQLPPDCQQIKQIEDALQHPEIWIIGGEEVYAQFLPYAQTIHITYVYARLAGDAYFPPINFQRWKISSQQHFGCDLQHAYAHSFVEYKI